MAETMIFKIRHADGTESLLESHANATIVTSAKQIVSENNQDVVKITILSAVPITLSIGDSIDIFGRRYWINQQVPMTKDDENNYKYDATFEGIQYQLARSSYDVNLDPTLTNADLRSDSLTGDLRRFVSVLIVSSQDGTPGLFEMGDVPEDTETKTLTFGDGDNCLSIAQRLSQEYNLPLSIDPNQAGTKYLISYGKETNVFGTQFKFGAGNGIYELKRDNVSSANIVNKLKVRGGTKNITNKYRCLNLLLPNKTRAQSYIVDQDSIDLFGVWTGKKTFTDIYPHRTGTVTAIDANDVQNFVDSAMDFDLNEVDSGGATKYLIDGLSPKIHFNSGNLAGYEFDIVSYNHTTKTFRIKRFTDEAGLVIPSDTSNAFKIAAGDKYVILDINMPDSYIEAAEEELEDKAEEYLAQNSSPKVKYSLTISEFFIKSVMDANPFQNLFWIGDFIPIKDDDIGVDKAIRITGFTRDLMNLYNYAITISDIAFTVSIQTRIIADMIEKDKIVQINQLNDPARARRNWKDAQELIGMVFDPDGYFTDKIRPASIETIALTVGAKSMQFGLVGTVFQPNYGGNGNRVVVTGGTLVHYTIDDQQAVSWSMSNGDFTMQSDSGVYYIYAKCSRTTNAGNFVFSTDPIKCESDPNYYYFWVGVLHSKDANTGTRAISLSYGFTQINGRYITTGRIQSADGNNYIDLDENKIRFGNQSCYIDWNVTQNGQFSLRNVKVVSGSGDAFDIPVYRGEWSSTATYYSGDEVDYTVDGKTTTYRYKNPTATSGHLPTETAYWKPVATGKDGQDGSDGASVRVQFSADTVNWHASFTTGDLYMRQRVGTGSWSSAIRIVGEKGDPGQNGQDGQDGQDGADGPYKSFVFKPDVTKPAKPTGTSPVPSGWYDAPPEMEDVTPTFTGSWTVTGKRIVSNTIGHSESTWEKIQIVTTKANTVVALRIAASSEARYDKGYICNLDADQSTSQYLAMVSGLETSTVIVVIPTAGTHFFWVGYAKDSSASANNDNVTVTVLDMEDVAIRVWMSSALVTDGVAGTWADPIAINGVNGSSPSSPFRGEYDSQTTYYGNSVRTDIVKYNGVYYRANPDAPNPSFSGHAPTDEAYWEQFGATFENLATGFFFAQEAVIDNAVVRILRTADSGKRIEIQNNEMSMYDASGVQKLNISGDDIDIGTPTASYKTNGNGDGRNYSTQGGSGQDNFSFDICTFTVPSGGSTVQFPAIHIQADVYQQYYGGSIDNMNASIQVLRGSSVVMTLGSKSTVTWGDVDSNAQSASLSAGTYTIRVSVSYEWTVDREDPYWNEIGFSLYDKTTGSIVVASSTVQAINIGANGIAIHLGNSFSAVFALNNGTPTMLLQGMNSSNQTVGLRVTSSGVQINRGSGWTNL